MLHIPERWNGYEYWMGYTPYAASNDDLENPCILASHDGINWRVPNGFRNPLENLISSGTLYNSDTELVLHEGILYCFWRRHDGANTHLRGRTTTDGVHWTQTQIFDAPGGVHEWTSPAIQVLDGTWHAWCERDTTGLPGAPKDLIYLTASNPSGPWSAPVTCTLNGLPPAVYIWHQSVVRHGGYWWLAMTDAVQLRLATSRDGVNWNVAPVTMGPSPSGGWDDVIIYRPSLLIEGNVARIWYGAQHGVGVGHEWRIGYTEIPIVKFPAPPD